MEERSKTIEAELIPPKTETFPQKPVRQIRRSEMYSTRKFKEEANQVLHQPVPKTLPREPSLPMSLQKCVPVQNLTQVDAPWENVTLNRCLFVVIAILVVTSGFQRLHETLRGQRVTEEEGVGLRERRSSVLRQRAHIQEQQNSVWEVVFWWLPDLADEDAGNTKWSKSKRKAMDKSSRGFRNRPHPDTKLTKQREGKLKDRRAKRDRDEVKEHKNGSKKLDKESGKQQMEIHIKNKRLEEKKENKHGDDVHLSP